MFEPLKFYCSYNSDVGNAVQAILSVFFLFQCVNDVIQERFASELKAETILRLAALHIQQHAMSNNVTGKINIKAIE